MKQVVSYEQRDDDRRYQLTYQNKIQGCSSDSWYVLRTHVQISKSHKCRVRYGRCPSWVTSGHFVTFGRCPLYPPKAGMSCWLCNVLPRAHQFRAKHVGAGTSNHGDNHRLGRDACARTRGTVRSVAVWKVDTAFRIPARLESDPRKFRRRHAPESRGQPRSTTM
jgi:hypothetical protein